jgi:hypothetical protein
MSDWNPECVSTRSPSTTLDLRLHVHNFAGLNGAIPNRLVACYMGDMEIEERNRLRAQTGLPLLDVAAEAARLKKAEDNPKFEKYFHLRRDEFRHLWSDRSRGVLTNMGICNAVRRALREEIQQTQGSRP